MHVITTAFSEPGGHLSKGCMQSYMQRHKAPHGSSDRHRVVMKRAGVASPGAAWARITNAIEILSRGS